MRFLPSLLGSIGLIHSVVVTICALVSATWADYTFAAAPASNLDISQLGRVAFTGDFTAASLFKYRQQLQNGVSKNGSLSLLGRFPSGSFAPLQSSDGYIQSMCALQQNGQLVGVLIGGNFTSLGGINSPGLALFKPESQTVEAISGLNGRVNAIYCDSSSGIAFVGGQFSALNNSNVIGWTRFGFKPLPFVGFNGAVETITMTSNNTIIFGGDFDGLGNSTTPKNKDSQQIPLQSANYQAGPATVQPNLSDISNIICKDPATDGPENAFLFADRSPGSITATFPFGFNPTLLRLGNTAYQGRGTKTWRFTTIPINGIMNLSYVDESANVRYCDSQCPMPQGEGATRDFQFVNPIGMSGFKIDVFDWYGDGAGLRNLQLFQNDIYTFAVNTFNEPKCPGATNPAVSQVTGTWTAQTSNGTDYLSTQVTDTSASTIVFLPDIKQSGNYSVTIFTPGCIQDNSCNTRGIVNITGSLASASSGPASTFHTEIFQTNNFDKYDQIFLGRVDASSSDFRPTITMAPSKGRSGRQTIVAQRIRFELVSTSGGLNGLFEYNPAQSPVDMNFRRSAIDSAATSLETGASIHSVIVSNRLLWIAGDFTSSTYNNIFSLGPNATSPPYRGLNGPVHTLYADSAILYLGGSFNATMASEGPSGLTGIAAYDTIKNTWLAVGSGVRGSVSYIVPFSISLPGHKTDLALAVSGDFDQLNGFASAVPVAVDNFAVWIPSRNNWLQNIHIPILSLSGKLTAQADVPKFPSLYAGSVSSFDLGVTDALQLSNEDNLSLQSFNVESRSTDTSSSSGILTGLYSTQNHRNLTILAGRFSAKAGNGSDVNNLVIIDGSNPAKLSGFFSGVDTGSTITSIGVSGDSLLAGGSLTGTAGQTQIQGLVAYDLSTSEYAQNQPPPLQGPNFAVHAIMPQPRTSFVFVGGDFISAGGLPCPALCVFNTATNQWNSPANGFGGVVASMVWVNDRQLVIAGNLIVNNTATNLSVYDTHHRTFTAASNTGAPNGSVTALTPGSPDGSTAWIAGNSPDGSTFISKYDGSSWKSAPALDPGSAIRGLQIFTLTKDHDQTSLLDPKNALLIYGSLVVPSYGNASAAVFNGTSFQPFIFTNTEENTQGTISSIFVSNPTSFFEQSRHRLAVGFVILIALAIALVLVFCIIGAGMFAEIVRRRRQGYVIAPSPPVPENMERIPPAELLANLSQPRHGDRDWSAKPRT